jgi:hypothetical protein
MRRESEDQHERADDGPRAAMRVTPKQGRHDRVESANVMNVVRADEIQC